MTTHAARQAVFNTVELLENVLIYLPLRQLFAVQRVSRQFKAAIKKSTQIQKKMFLRTGGEHKEEWITVGRYPDWSFIPRDSKHATDGSQPRRTIATANQAMFRESSMSYTLKEGACLAFNTAMLKSMKSLIKGGRHLWDHVYLCGPPCLSAKLFVSIDLTRYNFCCIFMEVTSQSGLTMGDLINDGRLSPAEFFSDRNLTDRPGLEGCQTIQECFDQLEREVGAPLKIHTASATIEGFLIPSENERRRVVK